jgi:hypothetical protein
MIVKKMRISGDYNKIRAGIVELFKTARTAAVYEDYCLNTLDCENSVVNPMI